MRKLILGAVGVTALATASMANATITLGSCVSAAGVCSVTNGATQSTIAFQDSNVPAGAYSGSIGFSNSLAGLYSIVVQSSTPGFLISSVTLDGISYGGAPAAVVGPLTGNLGVGSYTFAFSGTSPTPNGGAVSGNITFNLIPVPEPATWAMMLLGFAGIGIAMRRRVRPALAQLA